MEQPPQKNTPKIALKLSVFASVQDSNLCAAAIHAGVILNENGGECTVMKTEGQDFYPGSTKNGITSQQ